MDEGLLILRIALAMVLFCHATQKTLGWFQGKGLATMSNVFSGLGLRPGAPFVIAASITEIAAAISLITGFLTPLGAAAGGGAMLVAGMTMHHGSRNFWNAAGGGEYPYVLSVACIVLGFTGAGAYSLDAAIASAVPWWSVFAVPPMGVGIGVALLAVVSAMPFLGVLLRSRRHEVAEA